MYSDLEIKTSSKRAYVEFYIDGVRQREYNANKLNISIHPDRARSDSEKLKLLNKLKYEFQKALENGWKQLKEEKIAPIKITLCVEDQINEVISTNLNENYSKSDKKDLISVSNKFFKFLTPIEKNILS